MADEIKIDLYLNHGKGKVQSKGTTYDPEHTISSVKHGGGRVMWVGVQYMASSAAGSLVFIDNGTADGINRINSEVYRAILSDSIQPNSAKLITVLHSADQ